MPNILIILTIILIVLWAMVAFKKVLVKKQFLSPDIKKLNKLIVFYDSNAVTLDGPLSDSFDENVTLRFEAAGWSVLSVEDGNDIEAIDKAIIKAKTSSDKPVLIIVKTIIGQGSKNEGTHKVHGSPLGEEDGVKTKFSYGYTNEAWDIPQQVYETFTNTFRKRGIEALQLGISRLNNLNKLMKLYIQPLKPKLVMTPLNI